MRLRDFLGLFFLAATWGGSYIFMRQAVPEFGAIALIFVRVLLAALFLLPFLVWRRQWHYLYQNAVPLIVIGIFNSAVPFSLIAWALLTLTAGFGSIVNATSPLWAAIIAWLWFGDKLNRLRILGLLIGFAGVAILVSSDAGFHGENTHSAIAAGLVATLSYGMSANYAKRYLVNIPALAIAAGGQCFAALALAPLAWWFWPTQWPSTEAWGAVSVLAIASTALAYMIYFWLIASVGPVKAIAVTFLVPAFGIGWGWLLLDESVSSHMLAGAAIILLGTALAMDIIKLPNKMRATEQQE